MDKFPRYEHSNRFVSVESDKPICGPVANSAKVSVDNASCCVRRFYDYVQAGIVCKQPNFKNNSITQVFVFFPK